MLRKISTVHKIPLREETGSSVPGLFWILLYVPLSFADFNLYSFTVKNYDHEYNCFLSSVSPSNELLNLRVVLGTSNL